MSNFRNLKRRQVRRGSGTIAEPRPQNVVGPTISRARLAALAFCNSKDLPQVINDNGVRKQWVGIGWVEEGQAHGDEVVVTD